MPITHTDRHIIWTGVIIFNIFGLFGNLNIIYAHYRLTALRTKYGILLTLLVKAHTVCLLYEVIGVIYDVSGVPIIRKTCFYLLSPYIFTNCLQMALMASLSADLLLSIAAPLSHRSLRMKPYLTLLIMPGVLFGITVLILGTMNMDYAEIKLCQPPSSLPFAVRRVWYLIGLVFNALTVAAYLASFCIIYYKYRTNNDRDFSHQLSRLFGLFEGHYRASAGIHALHAFSALTVYSSTYYVCFARSSEYRRIFWSQIVGMLKPCGVKLNRHRFGASSMDELKKRSTRHCKFQPNLSYGHPSMEQPSMVITDTDRYIIWSAVVVFNFIGHFGNVNVIHAHYAMKKLRTKYGILLTIVVSSHSFCLLFELLAVVYDVLEREMNKRTCFYIISPYIFVNCIQMALMTSIAIDILFSIALPLKHRLVSKRIYLACLIAPAIIYGTLIVSLGFIFTDRDRTIELCQPPSSLSRTAKLIWCAIKQTHSIIMRKYQALHGNRKHHKHINKHNVEKNAMKSLSVLIVVHSVTRLVIFIVVNCLNWLFYKPELAEKVETYMVFSALIVYSSTFYVCCACSSEYRRIFRTQLDGIFRYCGSKHRTETGDDNSTVAEGKQSRTSETKY